MHSTCTGTGTWRLRTGTGTGTWRLGTGTCTGTWTTGTGTGTGTCLLSTWYKTAKCTKVDFGWGSVPDHAGGAYSAPPDPVAVFKGAYFWGEEREGKGEGKGRERGGKGAGNERGGEREGLQPPPPDAESWLRHCSMRPLSEITDASSAVEKAGEAQSISDYRCR